MADIPFPSWWKSHEGELKHFVVGPAPDGWAYANGHYNFETGAWIDDDLSPSASEKTAARKARRK